jgi:uncharacterized protein YecE (DUF72 family)
MSFVREIMRDRAAALAQAGIFIGTSSWKYPGWRGQLYDESRYVYHGRYAESRFERNCLTEYAEVFKTVSVDAAYYQFPTPRYLEGLASQVPSDFRFGFKVTDLITLKRFPNLARFGPQAGDINEHFLNAELFVSQFLQPCEAVRPHVGLLMFEFTRFQSRDMARGREFVEALDRFLGQLPRNWPYGVEIRNASFLQPEYFATLSRHGVAHIFNSWEAMPPIEEQLVLPGSLTSAELLGARFLLRPGRRYEEAVKQFSPYQRVQDPYPAGRVAGAKLLQLARTRRPKNHAFLFINNRFEGNALETITAMLDQEQAETKDQ